MALNPRLRLASHLEVLAGLFERAAKGQAVRACVSVPPQHGKTELVLAGLTWLLKKRPDWRLCYASYNSTQARDKSRLARDYALEAGLDLRRDAASMSTWLLKGSAGGLLSRGIGEGLTGQGLEFLVVDDPHKDRQEAESPAERRRVLDWFLSTATTRLHAGGSILVIHTRWHPDDLIGELVKQRDAGMVPWEVYNLPAFAEDGKALAPWLRDPAFLRSVQAAVGPYEWASLYMGQPVPRGAQVFSDAFYYQELPKSGLRFGVGVDLAYTAKTSADFSCCLEGVLADGRVYLTLATRAQAKVEHFGAVLAGARERAPGARMRWHCAGPERGVAELLNERHPGLRLEAVPATADKFARAQKAAALWGQGKVLLPADGAPWVRPFLSEVLGFTGLGDAHDDQVDALSSLVDCLTERRVQMGVTWL